MRYTRFLLLLPKYLWKYTYVGSQKWKKLWLWKQANFFQLIVSPEVCNTVYLIVNSYHVILGGYFKYTCSQAAGPENLVVWVCSDTHFWPLLLAIATSFLSISLVLMWTFSNSLMPLPVQAQIRNASPRFAAHHNSNNTHIQICHAHHAKSSDSS